MSEPPGRPKTEGLQIPDRALIHRLFALAWTYKWGTLQLLLINVILMVMGLSGLGLMGLAVDFIKFQSLPGTKPPPWPLGITPPHDWPPLMVLAMLAAGILAFSILRSCLNVWNAIASNRLVQGRIVVDLRAKVYARMHRLGFHFFDSNPRGSLINRVTGDVQAVRMFIDGVMLPVVMLVLSLAVCLIYMLSMHVRLTLASLACTPLLWVITRRFTRSIQKEYVRERELSDRQTTVLNENINGVHVVKGFARQAIENRRYAAANHDLRSQKETIFDNVSTFHPLVGFMTHINIIIMLAYGSYLVVAYERAPDMRAAIAAGISVGQLLVFNGLLQQFSGNVANIANIANNLQQCMIAARRVFEVLEAEPTVTSPTVPTPLRRARGHVEFRDVYFGYKPDEPVLSGISCIVRPGECVAVMGSTGSGKSTLLALLPRFYDPCSGAILIDGIDIRCFDLQALRRNLGIVFQESFMFSNTVAANIAYGRPEATLDEIEQAAKVAAAHDFILQLPDGYQTVLKEGGCSLSGGQRQRLSLARAILLDPPILLMDDPTSAIDPGTEKDIFDALDRATRGHTTFMVTHRISTLRRADRVIVLNDGKIVQSGTHGELMQQRGHYRETAEVQVPDAETIALLGLDPEGPHD
jgi:ATP-binding cassette subfamily B protein